MDQILRSLQNLLVDRLAPSQILTDDLPVGGIVVSVANTSRFRPGDEVMIMSTDLNKAEQLLIDQIPDYNVIILKDGTKRGWKTSESAFILKTIDYKPLKRVYLGDMRIIPDFPAITLTDNSESNEWMALRTTDHEYKMTFRVYVQNDNAEASYITLLKYVKQVREILFSNLHPIINGVSFPLTADILEGEDIVTVADTSGFETLSFVYLKDAIPKNESTSLRIANILSPTTLKLTQGAEGDYLVARQGEIMRVDRYLYDTRPSEISKGFVPGSGNSLMRAAEISYFAKERICRYGKTSLV